MAGKASTDPNVFILPDLGEGVHEAELISWKVEEGQTVEENDILAEMETDKALVEVPSPRPGTIKALHGSPGETMFVGKPLVSYVGEGEDAPEPGSSSEGAATPSEPPTASATREKPDSDEEEREDAGSVVGIMDAGTPGLTRGEGRALAAPAVRRLARDLHVPIDLVPGTGIGGRVTAKDVRAYAESGGASAQPSGEPPAHEARNGAAARQPDIPAPGEGSGVPLRPDRGGFAGEQRARDAGATPQQRAPWQTGPGQQQSTPASQPPAAAYGSGSPQHSAMPQVPAPMGYGPFAQPPYASVPHPHAVYPSAPYSPVPGYGMMPYPMPPMAAMPYPMAVPVPMAYGQHPAYPAHAPHTPHDAPLPPKAEPRPVPAPAQSSPISPDESEHRLAFRGVRKTIADRLRQSVNSAVHFTVTDEADVTELADLRRAMNERAQAERSGGGVKLSFLPFVARAVALALAPRLGGRFAAMNATVDDQSAEIIYHRALHLGVATDTEAGLMVPVVKDADAMGIHDIAGEIAQIAAMARDRSIPRERLAGSTFTISNVGSHAGRFATPIINVPEVAIIAVGRAYDGVVNRGGRLAPGTLMPLSLACDHRVIDGGTAALALAQIKQYLEYPEALTGS